MSTTYEIDPAHSNLQFSVRHLMVTNVRGSFTGVKGSVIYDPQNPSAAVVEATIDAATLHTGDEQRDTHVKSPDFLDVANYPTITFRSTKVQKVSDEEFKVTGNLTLHGVTKEVVLDISEVSPEAKDPWGKTRIGASARTKIKRSDYGLTWNAPLEAGGVLIGDDVKLDFELEFVKAQSAAA
ncbi:MAG: YceI family protein [Acidobacteriaceae bacterium]|nr:YceI family protein [Acidobacteriaceae bacterium]MBV8571333.1 YceI family protein [Acidobacteriaceae bacterium]